MTAPGFADRSVAASRTPALFGRVMALVAATVAFATLGVWLARNAGGAEWFIAWLLALGCLFALNVANARGNTALFVAALGSGGYAIRRDLSFLYRLLFWLLLALIAASIVLIFVHTSQAPTHSGRSWASPSSGFTRSSTSTGSAAPAPTKPSRSPPGSSWTSSTSSCCSCASSDDRLEITALRPCFGANPPERHPV